MVRRTILPIATKQGMTGAEALMSGNFEFAIPEMLSSLYQIPADALATYDAASSGLPVPDEEFNQKMMNMGSVMGGGQIMARPVGRAAQGIETVLNARRTGAGSVIRRDDQFRGEGDMPLSFISQGQTPADFAGQFAIRTTKQDQIDDIIQSGLVRQKVGGYGPKQKSTLYFGTQGSPETKKGFGPGQLTDTSPYAIVAKADEAAKYDNKGGIPLDALQHIWTIRDGKRVDILAEVKRKNRDLGASPSDRKK
jgi:hypothetical protein